MLLSAGQSKFVYHHYWLVFQTVCLLINVFFSFQLAKYCDSILKKSTKNLSDAELDEKLVDIVSELLSEITLVIKNHFPELEVESFWQNVTDKEAGRGSMTEWLECWTCYLDSPSLSPALTASRLTIT